MSFLKKWSIFVKSTYGSNYVVFSNISRNFRSRYHTVLTILSFQELYVSFDQKLFFLLQIFLKNTNQEQYGLTHNYPFAKIRPLLSKAHLVQTTLHFPKYLAKSEKKTQSRTIWFDPDCPFRKKLISFYKNTYVSICTFSFDKILSIFRSSVWNIIWPTLSFQGFSITFLQNLFCFLFLFLIYVINFIQGH